MSRDQKDSELVGMPSGLSTATPSAPAEAPTEQLDEIVRGVVSCFLNGRRYEPGEVVNLPDGVRGPHRAARQADEKFFRGAPPDDAHRILGESCDEPLFEVLPDEPEGHTAEQKAQADQAATLRKAAVARHADSEKPAESVSAQKRPGVRIRLKETCQFGGRLCEAGRSLSAGVKGPHRAVRKSHDRIDYGTNPPIDANRILGEIEDVPLYDVLPNEPEGHSKEQQAEADRAAKLRADTIARQNVPHGH